MIEVAALDSIAGVEPSQWNRLVFGNGSSGELEDWSYYHAVERAGLPDFGYVYFAIRDGARLLAAAPAFLTDYRLDTTVQGALKRVTETAAKVFPRLLRIPMLALGSPATERCSVGFDPDATLSQRAQWLGMILDKMEAIAARDKLGMLAIKDAAADNDGLWRRACPRRGLRPLPGLPGAALVLPYRDLDGYLASLGAATRKDLRRKLRAASGLTIAWRTDLEGIRDEVQRLYRATLEHSEFRFEELTPAYFDNVLRDMPGRAYCVTYSENDSLLAFNLVLCDHERLLDKFLGMDYTAMDRYNLYHASWLENVRHCIAHDISVYESGQGLHSEKLRLGGTLSANTLWYRHRNRFLDGVFARIDRLARVDRFDDKAQYA
ncbi:MAG: peptidogalycan biosysnthesis protein [Rhodanobacteraceae bacterium]